MKTILESTLIVLFTVGILMGFYHLGKEIGRASDRRVDEWHLQSYQYVITLQDDNWVEVRRADGSIVGQVQCDTTTQLGKLFYHDNE